MYFYLSYIIMGANQSTNQPQQPNESQPSTNKNSSDSDRDTGIQKDILVLVAGK